jgi:hypothetical protein
MAIRVIHSLLPTTRYSPLQITYCRNGGYPLKPTEE